MLIPDDETSCRLAHFLQFGQQEGRLPNDLTSPIVGPNGFDYNYYLTHNPDVAASGVDAYLHFLLVGWKEGRNPNVYFGTQGYLATYADVAAAGVNLFLHYITFGWKEGRDPSPAFDTSEYGSMVKPLHPGRRRVLRARPTRRTPEVA